MNGEHGRSQGPPSDGLSDDDPLGGPTAATAADEPSDDLLAGLRAAIDDVDDLPIDERLALFERVNAALASQLAALDEL